MSNPYFHPSLQALHKSIAAVCPIVGCCIGDLADRQTWTYWATKDATQAQLDAAQNVINTIDLDAVIAATPPEITLQDVIAALSPDQLATVQQAATARTAALSQGGLDDPTR